MRQMLTGQLFVVSATAARLTVIEIQTDRGPKR